MSVISVPASEIWERKSDESGACLAVFRQTCKIHALSRSILPFMGKGFDLGRPRSVTSTLGILALSTLKQEIVLQDEDRSAGNRRKPYPHKRTEQDAEASGRAGQDL